MITPAQARELFGRLALPEVIPLNDGTSVPLKLLAQAIADDSDAGDETLAPHWMLNDARAGVDEERLAALSRGVDGPLGLTGALALSCWAAEPRLLQSIAAAALTDLHIKRRRPGASPSVPYPVDLEGAAIAIVVGVLIAAAKGAN